MTSSMQPEDFPILCETCLGDNPYLRMTREPFSKACKTCERPFSVFRWRPGPRARYKKTEICPTCAKLKNVCQTCILDLEYGLPVQVRDEALTKEDQETILKSLPIARTNRNFMYEQLENGIGLGREGGLQLPYDTITKRSGGSQMLSNLQRSGPYYKRNLPHICSFYVKGTCNRGDVCPYRHEMPITGELADQNIRDRFYGVNDPVAKKLMKRFKNTDDQSSNHDRKKPEIPTDTSIRTLFIGSIDHSITDDHIIHKFSIYGLITNVNIVYEKNCAFVTFDNRQSSENAMNAMYNCLYLNNRSCVLSWGHSKNRKSKENEIISDSSHSKLTSVIYNNVRSDHVGNAPLPIGKYSVVDQQYLSGIGIKPPELPPMPDPCLYAPPPNQNVSNRYSQYGNSTVKDYNVPYLAMSSHYKEAKLHKLGNGGD